MKSDNQIIKFYDMLPAEDERPSALPVVEFRNKEEILKEVFGHIITNGNYEDFKEMYPTYIQCILVAMEAYKTQPQPPIEQRSKSAYAIYNKYFSEVGVGSGDRRMITDSIIKFCNWLFKNDLQPKEPVCLNCKSSFHNCECGQWEANYTETKEDILLRIKWKNQGNKTATFWLDTILEAMEEFAAQFKTPTLQTAIEGEKGEQVFLAAIENQIGGTYYPLFKFFSDTHNLTLLESEIQDIIQVVNDYENQSLPQKEKQADEEGEKELALKRYPPNNVVIDSTLMIDSNKLARDGFIDGYKAALTSTHPAIEQEKGK